MKTLGQFLEEAKATYCGRCGTRHVPPAKGGTCPALKEEVLDEGMGNIYIKKSEATHQTDATIWPDSDHPQKIETLYHRTEGEVKNHIKSLKKKYGAANVKVDVKKLREGYVPTADEPTEHDKKMAQKVRDLLAKEKKPKKMVEAAQIDELSKKTLGNYAYKAATDIGQHGITAGLKVADNEPTQKHFKKMGNRQKGIATAVKKLTKEEADKGIRMARVMHKGQHVANVITYRGRGGNWVSGAETPDGQNATKKYGIGLIDTKKEILKKIKQYHKENN